MELFEQKKKVDLFSNFHLPNLYAKKGKVDLCLLHKTLFSKRKNHACSTSKKLVEAIAAVVAVVRIEVWMFCLTACVFDL